MVILGKYRYHRCLFIYLFNAFSGGKELVEGNVAVPEAGLSVANERSTNNTGIETTLSLGTNLGEYMDHENSLCLERNLEDNVITEDTTMQDRGTSTSSKPRNNLKASIQASDALIELEKKKILILEEYYKEKIKIMKEDVEAKKRIATALENFFQ